MTPIAPGETAVLDVLVTEAMTVDFDRLGPVQLVHATYTRAKHFEEAGRTLLAHLEPGEAGVGTAVVEHLAPAWPGDRIRVTATCTEVRGNRLTCALTAVDADGRLLGRGATGQAVLSEEALAAGLCRAGDDPAGA